MRKLLKLSSVLAILTGIILISGGLWGVYFTYNNIAMENMVTPSDASIPEKPVRGPFTLKAQADIIRTHTLQMTGGLTYSEMPRQIPALDQDGEPVLDENGNPTMKTNEARDIWVTVVALTTALNLGILTYAFSGFIILIGLISIFTGIIFYILSRGQEAPSSTKS